MELCPELEEYEKWYQREFLPQLKKLAAHIKDCHRCQEYLMKVKDNIGLKMLLTSESDIFKRLEEMGDG